MSTIPRITIIVPLVSENAAFEATLVSVLEHRPPGCEVVVAHDGHYRDPFDLSDEVVFAQAESSQVTTLVRAALRVSQSRFVHVIAPGLQATEGWLDPALSLFGNPNVAAVAPTVVDIQSNRLVSEGWRDLPGRLCCPITTESSRSETGRAVTGCYLQASFWRQNVLSAVLATIDHKMTDLTAVTYAAGQLLSAANWQVRSTSSCRLKLASVQPKLSGAARGRVLSAIGKVVGGKQKPTSLVASLSAALTGRITFSEFVGQRTFASTCSKVARAIHPECMLTCGEGNDVLAFPSAGDSNARRAA